MRKGNYLGMVVVGYCCGYPLGKEEEGRGGEKQGYFAKKESHFFHKTSVRDREASTTPEHPSKCCGCKAKWHFGYALSSSLF